MWINHTVRLLCQIQCTIRELLSDDEQNRTKTNEIEPVYIRFSRNVHSASSLSMVQV